MFYVSGSFHNFGILCKSSYLCFPILLADCDDSEYSILEQILLPLRSAVASLIASGRVFINEILGYCSITFKLGKFKFCNILVTSINL